MRTATLLSLTAVLLPLAFAATEIPWNKVYVKWSIGGYLEHLLNTAFYELPLTMQKAQNDGWTQADSNDKTTTLCYKDDYRVCTLYDKQGNIAGLQISIAANEVKFAGNPYNVDNHPEFNKGNVNGVDVYSGRIFFVDQETLANGGRTPDGLIGKDLWIQKGSDYEKVPKTGQEIVDAGWTKENCIPTMGRHYYYNMTQQSNCEDMNPYFLLTSNYKDYMHGIGFQTFGKASTKSRSWFEAVPALAVKPTVPTAPDCLVDWALKYNIISLHVYFVNSPWLIMC